MILLEAIHGTPMSKTHPNHHTSQNGNNNEDPINISSNWIDHAVGCEHCCNLLKQFLTGAEQ